MTVSPLETEENFLRRSD